MNLTEVVEIAKEARRIMDSTADEEIKFDLIFGRDIKRRLDTLGARFDWCDPDTSYEEDANAYVCGLEDYVKRLGNLV